MGRGGTKLKGSPRCSWWRRSAAWSSGLGAVDDDVGRGRRAGGPAARPCRSCRWRAPLEGVAGAVPGAGRAERDGEKCRRRQRRWRRRRRRQALSQRVRDGGAAAAPDLRSGGVPASGGAAWPVQRVASVARQAVVGAQTRAAARRGRVEARQRASMRCPRRLCQRSPDSAAAECVWRLAGAAAVPPACPPCHPILPISKPMAFRWFCRDSAGMSAAVLPQFCRGRNCMRPG